MPLFFIYAKQAQSGFERDTRGYRVSTLTAAHDEYVEISKQQPHRRKQIYNEYLVIAENPYFMMSVPNEFSAREFADSLYASGILDRYEYNRILTKSGIDEPGYKGIAAKHINRALQEQGIDSIVYMNGTYDRGSIGVMVLDESQLILVSQNGVPNESFVENVRENTFDNDDDNDIIKINNRNSYIGRPTAIYTLDVNLNMRQQKILDALPQYDSYLITRKESVSMSDLSALTAKTGVEFAMFTRGSERLIIRGSQRNVNVNLEKAKQLAQEGYKFSGHTHPGGDYNCLTASGSDYEILKAFNQKQSVTYNSKGYYMTYEL